MQPNKPADCCHKILQFQAHRQCHLFASICQKECQEVHNSGKDQIMLITLETVQEQYSRIMRLVKEEVTSYTDKIKYLYREILAEIHKVQVNNLQQMQKELLAQATKHFKVERSVLEKLQNKRYERIRCFELISLIEEVKPQQKIKKSALDNILQKYKNQANIFRTALLGAKTAPTEPPPTSAKEKQVSTKPAVIEKQKVNHSLINTGINSALLNNNNNKYLTLFQQKKKELIELQDKYTRLKYQKNLLLTQKSNLQREIYKFRKPSRNFSFKTWSIAQVISKRIKKPRKQNLHKQGSKQLDLQENEPCLNEQMIAEQARKTDPRVTKTVANHQGPQQNGVNQQNQKNGANQQKNLSNSAVDNQIQEEEQDFFDYLRKRKLV